MTQIDGLSFTQLDNLNILGELYEHGVPFGGGVTAPLILSTANNDTETPLTLRGGGDADTYDDNNSGLTYNDANNNEIWRIWGSDPASGPTNVQNLFIGLEAGDGVDPTNTLRFNTGVGAFACNVITNGENNSAFGHNALVSLTGGDQNTAIGSQTLISVTGGLRNTAVGYGALIDQTGNDATAVGFNALAHNVSARNTAIGSNALETVEGIAAGNGNQNTAVGYFAMQSLFSGGENVAIGDVALTALISGNNNVAVGVGAMFVATTGSGNTAVGRATLDGVTTGGSNLGLGNGVATNLETGSRNTYIGHGVQATGIATDDEMNICNVITADLSVANGAVIIVMDTSESATAGVLWNDAGTVKVSQS